MRCGELKVLTLEYKEGSDSEPAQCEAEIVPERQFDVGAGKGKLRRMTLTGGAVGVIVDARCRPLVVPSVEAARITKLRQWLGALGLPGA